MLVPFSGCLEQATPGLPHVLDVREARAQNHTLVHLVAHYTNNHAQSVTFQTEGFQLLDTQGRRALGTRLEGVAQAGHEDAETRLPESALGALPLRVGPGEHVVLFLDFDFGPSDADGRGEGPHVPLWLSWEDEQGSGTLGIPRLKAGALWQEA